ncbi:hypothetical protein [Melittangium boletus]|uniref:hypothetical protein n=1 Tax=Melittangium boletus TaxID=83453 RepID=UPI003DA22C78
MKRLLGVMSLLAAVGVAQAQSPKPQAAAPVPAAPAADASAPSAGGLTWTAPKDWEAQPARPMRAATYRIAPAKGDTEPAELAIFYFGAGQGGAVDANVKRWVGQFQKPDGTAVTDKEVRTRQEKLNGLAVTTVDVKGTYTGGGPMMGPSSPKPNARLLGAIVEGPEGPLFFKLTGGERTVGGAEKTFRKLVESVKQP